MNVRWRMLVAALCLLVGGCGPSGPETVAVEGTVTYHGGDWPTPGSIIFMPEKAAGDLPRRPTAADFDVHGNFRVTSFKPGDGLVPGQYKAVVECWKSKPRMDSPTRPESYVPAKYRSPATSGLEVTIEPGQSSVALQWDIAAP